MPAHAQTLSRRRQLAALLLVCCASLPSVIGAQGAPSSGAAALLIEARHAGALVRFYESDLQLPVLARDLVSGRVVFDAAGTQLVVVPRRPMDEPQNATVRLLLPCASLDSARVRLARLQVPFRDMQLADGTAWALFFQDPEGNPLGYCTPATQPGEWPTALRGSGALEHRGDSGATELMVYGGFYGAWLSAAIPIGLGVDEASSVGACVLLASPLAVIAAHQYATHARTTRGQARTISVLGNWATWQGIGWTLAGNGEGQDAVLAGALAGTGVIVATAALVRGHDISAGQSTVVHAATYWAAWYGVVGAGIADANEDGFLYATLASSTAGLLGAAVWGSGHDISASRARLISLGGLLGTLMGWGIDLLINPDSEPVVWAIPGATGVAGLGFGWWRTRYQDDRQSASIGWRFDPPAFMPPHRGERLRARLVSARF
jgi:hypothetical protein